MSFLLLLKITVGLSDAANTLLTFVAWLLNVCNVIGLVPRLNFLRPLKAPVF